MHACAVAGRRNEKLSSKNPAIQAYEVVEIDLWVCSGIVSLRLRPSRSGVTRGAAASCARRQRGQQSSQLRLGDGVSHSRGNLGYFQEAHDG